jgi:hypothetical protein
VQGEREDHETFYITPMPEKTKHFHTEMCRATNKQGKDVYCGYRDVRMDMQTDKWISRERE